MHAWEVRLLNFWSQQKIISNQFQQADSLITIALLRSGQYGEHVPSLDYRDALFQKANTKFYLQQWDSSLQVVKTLQVISHQAGDYFNESISICNEANIYAITRQMDAAIIDSLYQQAYKIAQQTSTLHDDVMMLHNYASWLKGAPRYDVGHSLKVLLDIQDIAQHPELAGYFIPPYYGAPFFFRGTYRLMLMELANSFFYLGNFDEAARYTDEVIQETRNRKFSSYNIIYKAYIETYRNSPLVVDSILKAGLTRHYQYFSDPPKSPTYFYCLGWLAEQIKDYPEAIKHYKHATDRQNFQNFGNDSWEQVNEHHLALFRTYIKAKSTRLADSLFSRMNARMTQNLTPYYRIYLLKELPAYYILKNRESDALRASLAYYQLKDSLTGISSYTVASQHEKQFQLKEKDRMLALAQKENELKQNQLDLKQEEALLMGVILVALVALLLLVYKNYRLKGKLATKLKLKNDQIETLAQELHHRVKNNLQVVSGLLSMQTNRLKNEQARQAMEEGKGRVEAMALIHQKLSIDSVYTIVNMREYVMTLCDSIAESYGHDPDAIMLYDDNGFKTANINIEKAVPIGLIINEIVTNAFKHAFGIADKPQVRVSLNYEGKFLAVEIGDNGPGIQPHEKKPQSAGRHLIEVLVKQLEANMTIDNRSGTLYRILIPMNE